MMEIGGAYTFWLGASADAGPCGECPLRGAIAEARDTLLDIDFDAIAKRIDAAWTILDGIPEHHP